MPVNRDTIIKLLKKFHPWNEMSPGTIGDMSFIDGL
jgi:hypothetical protein